MGGMTKNVFWTYTEIWFSNLSILFSNYLYYTSEDPLFNSNSKYSLEDNLQFDNVFSSSYNLLTPAIVYQIYNLKHCVRKSMGGENFCVTFVSFSKNMKHRTKYFSHGFCEFVCHFLRNLFKKQLSFPFHQIWKWKKQWFRIYTFLNWTGFWCVIKIIWK